MYHTTGFTKDEIIDLCALVYANEENCDIDPWPPSLGLYKSAVIALTYMRRNRVQQELAETYNTSQSTISRANSRITSRLAIVLSRSSPPQRTSTRTPSTSTTARCSLRSGVGTGSDSGKRKAMEEHPGCVRLTDGSVDIRPVDAAETRTGRIIMLPEQAKATIEEIKADNAALEEENQIVEAQAEVVTEQARQLAGGR